MFAKDVYRLVYFSVHHQLIQRKCYLFLHNFCHSLKWIYIEIWEFFVSKNILLVISFVRQFLCQFVDVLPMFYARTGNNKLTSRSQSFASNYKLVSTTKMPH